MQLVQLKYRLDDSILTKRTLHLIIGEVDVRGAIDKEVSRIRRKVTVPGFRKGKATSKLVRNHYWSRIQAACFRELKQAALEQILQKLEAKDRPFLPTQVIDEDKVSLDYGRPLEFAVEYMVDPSGMGSRPQQAASHFSPLDQIHAKVNSIGPGNITIGPKIPNSPAPPSTPKGPQLPSIASETARAKPKLP